MSSLDCISNDVLHNLQKLHIPLRWLTMIYGSGDCQICKDPQGNTRTYYINIKYNSDNKFGFLVCSKEECNLCIQAYIKNLYSNIYNTKTWKRILNIYANNLFIKVERSNGDIENDWILDNDSDHDSNKIPLRMSFIYAILCCNKNNEYAKLPIELWIYIYNICLETYKTNINLTLCNYNTYNTYNNLIEPSIRVKKGDIYKNLLLTNFL